MLDPVDQADNLTWVQMSREGRHPHYRGCLVGNLSDVYAPEFAQWQATTFRLLLAQ